MKCSYLLVILAVLLETAAPQGIFFPDSNADKCPGRCRPVRLCPAFQGSTVFPKLSDHCGFLGNTVLVCCPQQGSSGPNDADVVSKPDIKFQCGVRSVLSTHFTFPGAQPSAFFSPGASLPIPLEVLQPAFVPSPLVPGLKPFTSFKPSRLRRSSTVHLDREVLPKDPETPPIAGGFESSINSWPWMALLGVNGTKGITWKCDAVLINTRWVLTAAHCPVKLKFDVVRLGEHDYTTTKDGAPHENFGIAEVVYHPDYKYPAAHHDLALMKLDRSVTLTSKKMPLCLPWGAATDLRNRRVTVMGWGATEFNGEGSTTLQEVRLTVYDSKKCNDSYSSNSDFHSKFPKGIEEDMLCIGERGGKSACQGDSGGPVVYSDGGKYLLAGIVSTGYGCGHADYPGIYASVHYRPHLAWIKRVAF